MYHNAVQMIGEFEYLILAAATRLGDDAYGALIRKEIESATGGGCSIGALYTTLDRLEAKSFIRTWMGDPTPERGGRSKRRVRITPLGVKAAADFFKVMSSVSEGVPWARNQATR